MWCCRFVRRSPDADGSGRDCCVTAVFSGKRNPSPSPLWLLIFFVLYGAQKKKPKKNRYNNGRTDRCANYCYYYSRIQSGERERKKSISSTILLYPERFPRCFRVAFFSPIKTCLVGSRYRTIKQITISRSTANIRHRRRFFVNVFYCSPPSYAIKISTVKKQKRTFISKTNF